MYEPLIGKISKILEDHVITGREFAKFEQALFAGDGLIHSVELLVVNQMLHPDLYQVDEYVFQDPIDSQRFEILATQGSYTLERYTTNLRRQNLSPNTRIKKLERLSKKVPRDKLPRVQGIHLNEDGYFEVKLRKGNSKIKWHYQGETDLKQINDFLQPFGFLEVYLALEEFRGQRPSEQDWQETYILQTMARLYQKAMEEDRVFQIAYLANYEKMIFPLTDDFLNDAPVTIDGTDLPPLFYGLQPNEEAKEAIENTLGSLPSKVSELLLEKEVKIHLTYWSTIARDFYNENPEVVEPVGEWGGLTSPLSNDPRILLPIDKDPQYISYALGHEVGHTLYYILDMRTGGEI